MAKPEQSFFSKHWGVCAVALGGGLVALAALWPEEQPKPKTVDELKSENAELIAKLPNLLIKSYEQAGQVLAKGPNKQSCADLKSTHIQISANLTLLESNTTLLEFRKAISPDEVAGMEKNIRLIQRQEPGMLTAIAHCAK